MPDGRPVSVSVTEYVTSVKVTDCDTDDPMTVNEPPPEDHDLLVVATLYAYVPFTSLNVIVVAVLLNDWLLVRLTHHSVPDGRPDSVNTTLYSLPKYAVSVIGESIVIACEELLPV